MRTTFTASIVFSFFLLFFSISMLSMNKLKSTEDTTLNEKNCSIKKLILKTERIEKKRKFIFWKLPHKKIITVDRIVNTKGKIVLKKTSIQICSSDACDDRKLCRIKIVNNEIWIFQYDKNPKKGIIRRYDFCKKYLGQKIWDEENFNDY